MTGSRKIQVVRGFLRDHIKHHGAANPAIIHACNTYGVWGDGISADITAIIGPGPEESYKRATANKLTKPEGTVIHTVTCNQDGYSYDVFSAVCKDQLGIDYIKLAKCLSFISNRIAWEGKRVSIACPAIGYGVGSNLTTAIDLLVSAFGHDPLIESVTIFNGDAK